MQSYSIGELAREFAVTARTIRHYEEIGLLAPQRRGQTRVYSPADRVRLKLILRGKRLGFSLEESRDIISMYDPAHDNRQQLRRLLERVREQRRMLDERLREMRTMLDELSEVEAGCLEALGETPAKTKVRNRSKR